MAGDRRAAIVGAGESDLGRTPDKTVLQLQAQAARAAPSSAISAPRPAALSR